MHWLRLGLLMLVMAGNSIGAPRNVRRYPFSGNLIDELNAMILLLPDDAWTKRCIYARLIKAQTTPQELLDKWDQLDCGNLSTYRYLTSLSEER